MSIAHAVPKILFKVNEAFDSLFLGMHESRRQRAQQIIREWRCDER